MTTFCTVATALVSSRLDYANSILYGIPANSKGILSDFSLICELNYYQKNFFTNMLLEVCNNVY